MPDIERYTPSQMEDEIQDLAEKYVSAVGELGEDTAIFNDISTAIQSKTGQVEPYEKDEMAEAISNIAYPPILESKVITPELEEKTYTPTAPSVGFNSVTVEAYVPPVPLEEKDVNFYDYDGTLLYSYTLSEAQALSELPPLPVIEGYIYQEWNWTLRQIKDFALPVNVGAVRVPSDGSSIGTFKFHEGDTRQVGFNFTTDGNIAISWGDGYIDDYSGTVSATHEYVQSGLFVAKILPSTGASWAPANNFISKGKLALISFEFGLNSGTKTRHSTFHGCAHLEKVSLGNSFTRADVDSFRELYNLSALIFPSSCNTLDANSCRYLGAKIISLPPSVSVGDDGLGTMYRAEQISLFHSNSLTARSCRNSPALSRIYLSSNIIYIPASVFQGCTAIENIVIPSSVSTIGAQAFYNCSALEVVDTSAYTNPQAIPTLDNVNSFANTSTTLIILVANQEMLDAFTSATNWSTYADRFQIKGE